MTRSATVDVVGHFGSRFSYATHAVELARALRRENLLGRIVNLDPTFLEDYLDELGYAADSRSQPSGRAAFVISAPTEPTAAFARCYDLATLFVCPNTDRLSDEARHVALEFSELVTPSFYGRDTVGAAIGREHEGRLFVHPLGAHEVFCRGRLAAREMAARRRERGQPLRAVHFSSDWFWPGRKGTEELIEVWEHVHEQTGLELTIHCVGAMRDSIYYYCADRGLHEPVVKVVSPLTHGSMPHQLFEHMAAADVVIHPSRAEGFGMIALSALLARVPLVTTAATGMTDYLDSWRDREGEPLGWARIEHGELAPLEGEEGAAPLVSPDPIADAIVSAVGTEALPFRDSPLGRMRLYPLRSRSDRRWVWPSAMGEWVVHAHTMLARTC